MASEPKGLNFNFKLDSNEMKRILLNHLKQQQCIGEAEAEFYTGFRCEIGESMRIDFHIPANKQ